MIIIPVHCNDSDKDNDDDGDDDNDKYTNSNLISCNNHFILKAPFTLLLTHILSMGGGSIPLPLIFWSRIFTITTCTNCKTHFHNCSSIMNTSFDTD